ncbi:Mutator family transposase [Vibrio rarus]
MTQPFDFDQALKALQAGKSLTAKDSVLGQLIKQLTEAALTAELDLRLDNDPIPNRKNGKTSKTIKHPSGSFELDAPRDVPEKQKTA